MKLTNTDFNMRVNESSSYIVYITKSKEAYNSIYQMEMKKRELLHDQLVGITAWVAMFRSSRIAECLSSSTATISLRCAWNTTTVIGISSPLTNCISQSDGALPR